MRMVQQNADKFDTKVQHLKYKVLREVARQAWNGHADGSMCWISPRPSFPARSPPCAAASTRSAPSWRSASSLAMGGDKCQSQRHRGHRHRLRRVPRRRLRSHRRLPRLSGSPLRGCLPPGRHHLRRAARRRISTRASAWSAASAPRSAPTPPLSAGSAPARTPAR